MVYIAVAFIAIFLGLAWADHRASWIGLAWRATLGTCVFGLGYAALALALAL